MSAGHERHERKGQDEGAAPLRIVLEFARAAQVDDPYAFQFTPQAYIVHTPGGGFASAEFAWDAALLADLQALREARCEPARVQQVGERLRRFLGGTGWVLAEQRIIEAVGRGRQVVLTVRSAAAELYALPWELVTIRSTGQHIGELPDCLVRYEWPETATIHEQRVERGRILFAWSAAAGSVPASEQLAMITAACEQMRYPFDAARDVVAHASCEGVVAALRAAQAQGAPFTVLHLLCHGAAQGRTFGLALSSSDPGEAAVIVDAGRLRQLLAPFAATLRLVVLAACDGGNIGALGNHLGSVAQTLHRSGIQAVVASRFPLSVFGANRLTRTLYQGLLLRLETVEAAVTAARAELARDAARLDWASLQYYARASDGEGLRPLFVRPYRGLMPFRPEHGWAFFGRAAEAAELRARVVALLERREPRFVVVGGAAGVGKTSLILAGLVPALQVDAGLPWRVIELAPGPAPIADLAAAIGGLAEVDVAPNIDGVWAGLQSWQARDPGRGLIVVLDPLEELFSQTAELAQRVLFMRTLWKMACSPAQPVVVVTALRIDAIGRCGEIVLDAEAELRLDQVAYDERHRVFVAQLGAAQLREAIEGPARVVGAELDPGLAERIVADVAGQPGALPIFQHALMFLWKEREVRRLTMAAYDALGGVGGALEQHAEGVLEGMSPAQLRQARRTLVRLAGAGEASVDLRRRVPVDRLLPADFMEAEAFKAALARMVAARLVVLGEQTGPRGLGKLTTVELVNEVLTHRWQRLRGWVREDRSRVVDLMKIEQWLREWQEHGALLDAQRLGFALEIVDRAGVELPAEALDLIERSAAKVAALRQEEARRLAELEGMLEATKDLLRAADEDMARAEAEIVRLRRSLRVAAGAAGALAAVLAAVLLAPVAGAELA